MYIYAWADAWTPTYHGVILWRTPSSEKHSQVDVISKPPDEGDLEDDDTGGRGCARGDMHEVADDFDIQASWNIFNVELLDDSKWFEHSFLQRY